MDDSQNLQEIYENQIKLLTEIYRIQIEDLKTIYEKQQEKQIQLYEKTIKDKNSTIEKLEMRIRSLETLLGKIEHKALEIYNQYNYQTTASDMSNIEQTHSGSGDNIGNIGRDKNTTNIYNSQNLTEAAKEIKDLLNQLDQEYNNSALVGAKAIEKIENNPSLKARFIKALKEGGTEALNQLINHPACSIVLAAGKGFIDAE